MKAVYLKPGREKSVLRHHPWIFSGSVREVIGDPAMGETVEIFDANNKWLARAAYSPFSSIRARIWTFDEAESITKKFILDKLNNAIAHRNFLEIINSETNVARLVHAESDGLPGLIVDKYDQYLVVQILSAGAEYWRDAIVEALIQVTGVNNILERSDVEVRKLEGMTERVGVLAGNIPTSEIQIVENGLRFYVDLSRGQKTGFFIDQRANRKRLQDLVKNKEILNCFSYTGAFTAYALAAGASHVTSIESSEEANLLAARNLSLNNFSDESVSIQTSDVFSELRTMRDKALSYDVVILDPPKFAPTAAQVRAAARGYKDINLYGFKLLRHGGILVTFSCSGGVTSELFQKIVADAALDAGVDAKIIDYLSQGADHPVALNFPEGAYLKGLICRVD